MLPTFSITRRVLFSETDLAGVVHFAQYFRMMEEVEHAFFRSLGLSVSMEHEGVLLGWPRVACSCDFSGPLRFEDEVELKLNVRRVGGKSLQYEVDFIREGQNTARGKLTSVCAITGDGGFRAVAIPDEIRRRLSGEESAG